MDEVRLLKKLVEIDSSESSEKCARFIAEKLQQHGIEGQIVRFGNVSNVLAVLKKGSGKTLILNGHFDTVPSSALWKSNPFEPVERSGKLLVGLGVVDMKGGLAAMIACIAELREEEFNGTIILMATGDEEIGSDNGTPKLIEMVERQWKQKIDFAIVGEPTLLKMCIGQRGGTLLKAIFKGIAGHGGNPTLGESAIFKASAALQKLKQHALSTGDFLCDENKAASPDEIAEKVSLNIGMISGGKAVNVIPDECEFTLDFRIPFGTNVKSLKDNVKKLTQCDELIMLQEAEPWQTRADSELCTAASEVLAELKIQPELMKKAGYNDSRYFAYKDIQVVNVGPGDALQAHKANEEIELNQVKQTKEFYKKLALKLLK